MTERLIRDAGIQVAREDVVNRFQQLLLGKDGNGLIHNERLLVAPESLRRLKKRFRLGVVTGRQAGEARLTLERLGLIGLFDVVVTRDHVPEGKDKPEPDGLLQAMERLQVHTGIYLGDTVDDVLAGLRAGLVPVGIQAPGAGRLTRRRLLEAGAVRVLASVHNLEEWIDAKRDF